jgi:hypothetical protein
MDVTGHGVSALDDIPVTKDDVAVADVAPADVVISNCRENEVSGVYGVQTNENCCCTSPVKRQHIGGARLGRPVSHKGGTGIIAPSPRAGKGRGSSADHLFEMVSLK